MGSEPPRALLRATSRVGQVKSAETGGMTSHLHPSKQAERQQIRDTVGSQPANARDSIQAENRPCFGSECPLTMGGSG